MVASDEALIARLAAGVRRDGSTAGCATPLWLLAPPPGPGDASVHVTLPAAVRVRRPGITVHRHPLDADEVVVRDGVPVTGVAARTRDASSPNRNWRSGSSSGSAGRACPSPSATPPSSATAWTSSGPSSA